MMSVLNIYTGFRFVPSEEKTRNMVFPEESISTTCLMWSTLIFPLQLIPTSTASAGVRRIITLYSIIIIAFIYVEFSF